MSDTWYPLKLYALKKPHLVLLSLSVALNVAAWIELGWQIGPQDESIFLHYNVLFGVDFLGAWWKVFLLPGMGLCILLLNTILGWALYQKDSFASLMLQVVACACQLAVLVASFLLIFLNV